MRSVYILLTMFCLIPFQLCQESRFLFNPAHLIDSARSVVTGIGSQVVQGIFSPRDLLRGSRQVLFGLPEVAVFRTIHELCSLYLSSGNINPMITPDIQQMYFQLRTPCSSLSYPIEQAGQILDIDEFDVNKPVVLFISGWTSTIESDSILHMSKAYNCRGGYNFLALNASYFIDTLYTWSAFNTEAVGRIVAQGLVQLYKEVPAENIHLIGFSLGAHIAGFAARYFEEETGEKIQRITGLDPANPCFGEGQSLAGLQKGDANFVDVIHTNPGALGKRDPLGDIDFYVQGFAPIKPGCRAFGCSHTRAWKYYAESVYPGHELDFLATRCSTLRKAERGQCKASTVFMGIEVPLNGKGTYVLRVNSEVPYGENASYNSDLILSQCGFCEE
ncbi:vitellogenin-1-like [Lucilia cuprina]|uniref:vitellogenin-1-like n=1 Tax=Lucilia cuprina TaxID=7375 RepID=UPI001F057D7E|nr:vitellogenin-1-like [Lucilia cuprina]